MMLLSSAMTGLGLLAASSSAAASRAAFDESKLPIPKAPLQWGDINVFCTTDTHGWLEGHRHTTWPEPNYSANVGDLASFLVHMRARAEEKGVDLLLVDAGDHHDGPGLVGSSTYGADKADALLNELEYDVLAMGNHELYSWDVAYSVYQGVQNGRWNGRYLTSNTNITLPDGRSVPLGDRYAKFDTKRGKKVTAFGILYNFQANAENITVQAPAELVKESWFLKAIEEEPDVFILAGHMPVSNRDSDFYLAFNAIREIHPTVPILIFGGHSHIRDCTRLDGRSMSLQPGRFMETLGWMSVNLTSDDPQGPDLPFSRRYLDNNVRTFKYHAEKKGKDFDTPLGLAMTQDLQETVDYLNLSIVLGHSPSDFFMARSSPESNDSVYHLLMNYVLPSILKDEKVDKGQARLFLANSGCQRYDVFKGPFTVNDQYMVSPFNSPFVYYEIKAKTARGLLRQMNINGATQFLPSSSLDDSSERSFHEWSASQWMEYQQSLEGKVSEGSSSRQKVLASVKEVESLTPGYVTRDKCGGQGDDVMHIPVRRLIGPLPDYVGSHMPEGVDDEETVLVVVMDFFVNDVVKAARQLDPTSSIRLKDYKPYSKGIKINDVWALYAKQFW